MLPTRSADLVLARSSNVDLPTPCRKDSGFSIISLSNTHTHKHSDLCDGPRGFDSRGLHSSISIDCRCHRPADDLTRDAAMLLQQVLEELSKEAITTEEGTDEDANLNAGKQPLSRGCQTADPKVREASTMVDSASSRQVATSATTSLESTKATVKTKWLGRRGRCLQKNDSGTLIRNTSSSNSELLHRAAVVAKDIQVASHGRLSAPALLANCLLSMISLSGDLDEDGDEGGIRRIGHHMPSSSSSSQQDLSQMRSSAALMCSPTRTPIMPYSDSHPQPAQDKKTMEADCISASVKSAQFPSPVPSTVDVPPQNASTAPINENTDCSIESLTVGCDPIVHNLQRTSIDDSSDSALCKDHGPRYLARGDGERRGSPLRDADGMRGHGGMQRVGCCMLGLKTSCSFGSFRRTVSFLDSSLCALGDSHSFWSSNGTSGRHLDNESSKGAGALSQQNCRKWDYPSELRNLITRTVTCCSSNATKRFRRSRRRNTMLLPSVSRSEPIGPILHLQSAETTAENSTKLEEANAVLFDDIPVVTSFVYGTSSASSSLSQGAAQKLISDNAIHPWLAENTPSPGLALLHVSLSRRHSSDDLSREHDLSTFNDPDDDLRVSQDDLEVGLQKKRLSGSHVSRGS
ncbi:hypothetical protein KP509_10G020600 [Ceratopteris richardii]|uniref:Uncharacterized protein n=1 Tax=Ceratopteris richardii TaxID=49495 RepID=A0A8T2TTZ8_CERRI|nr:hypothetical protein KP509_10G020600 [Ceratopteris richardii]